MQENGSPIPLVGVDIGKNIHVVGSYRSDTLAALHEPFNVYNSRPGFERLAGHLEKLLSEYAVVQLANEPTGVYYEGMSRQLQAHFKSALSDGRLRYHLVNPQLVKLSRQALQNGRRRKSDAIDTQAIARCLQLGQVMPVHLPSAQALDFEQWAVRYQRSERDKRTVRNRLMGQLDRLWPGAFINVKRFEAAHAELDSPVPLVQTRPLERQLVRALLTHCPNPYDVLAFTESDMLDFLQEYVGGRPGLHTTRKVLRNVRQALLPPPEVAAVYSLAVTEDWRRYQQLEHDQAQLMTQAQRLVPDSPAAVLLSVPGISVYLAARYWAAIGDIQRFPSADHIWAFAGLDPVYQQSGDGLWIGQLSKRGDPAFRDTLFLIGQSTARHCPPITQAFRRAYRAQRRRRVVATLHAAHKANRLLFHLLLHQEVYCPSAHH
jgi:transposase